MRLKNKIIVFASTILGASAIIAPVALAIEHLNTSQAVKATTSDKFA